MGSRLAVAALALTMTVQPLLAQSAPGYQYFRMYGGGYGQGGPPVDPATAFSYTIAGPASVAVGGTATFVSTVRNAVGPVAFSVYGGALPAGVSLDPVTGAVGGVTSQIGNFNATLRAVDQGGHSALAQFSLAVVDEFRISGAPATTATAQDPYRATFVGSGGSQPFSFSATGLPAGLSLTFDASTATISGSPAAAGETDIVLSGVDSHGLQASTGFHLVVLPHPTGPLAVSGIGSPAIEQDAPYSAAFTATGGTGGNVWSTQGTLPPGLAMDPATGVLSGTPTTLGVYSGLKAVVTDQTSTTATSAAFQIRVFAPLAASWNPALAYQTGDAISATATGTGGDGTYVWSAEGALPTGVTLNAATGALSGHATLAGSYGPVRLRLSDGVRSAYTSYATFVVTDPPPLAIASPTVPDGMINETYPTLAFTASGGKPGYSYTVSGSSTTLPPGMTLDASGVLSGTPTAPYDQTIRITAKDQTGATASTPLFRLHVYGTLVLTGSAPQYATVGEPYVADQFYASGGSELGYIFDIFLQPLPDGLTLDPATGVISGVPTTAGTTTHQLHVVDSMGNEAFSFPAFQITVQPPAPPVTGYVGELTLPTRVVVGMPMGFTILGDGGFGGPYQYAPNPSRPLPDGLTIDPDTGILSGTPQVAGTFPISIVVTDISQEPISGYANVGNLVISTLDLVPGDGYGIAGQPYDMPFSVMGSSGDVTFSLGSGSLPSGLSVVNTSGTTGAITGTTTQVGTWAITILAHDNVTGATVESRPQSAIQVAPAANACFAGGVIGPGAEIGSDVVTQPFTSSIGQSQISGFSLNWTEAGHDVSGTGLPLPDGLSWDYASGSLSGKPAAGSAGIYGPFVVTVQDNQGGALCGAGSSSPPFSLEVVDRLQITTTSLSATAGQTSTAKVEAIGGKPNYRYSLRIDQSLPPALSLDPATGDIFGITQLRGTFPLDITVTDAWGYQDTRQITLTVN